MLDTEQQTALVRAIHRVDFDWFQTPEAEFLRTLSERDRQRVRDLVTDQKSVYRGSYHLIKLYRHALRQKDFVFLTWFIDAAQPFKSLLTESSEKLLLGDAVLANALDFLRHYEKTHYATGLPTQLFSTIATKAIETKNLPIVMWLFTDAQQPDIDFSTVRRLAFRQAAEAGQLDVVQWLTNRFHFDGMTTADTLTAVCWAAWKNRLAVVRWLISDSAAPLDATQLRNEFQVIRRPGETATEEYLLDVITKFEICSVNEFRQALPRSTTSLQRL